MTVYYLHKDYDEKKFKEICDFFEKNYAGFEKEKLLIDVDYSLIQLYRNKNKDVVKIVNDAETEVISAETNLDLWDFKYTTAKFEKGKLIRKQEINMRTPD